MSPRYQAGTIEELQTSLGPCWFIRFSRADGTRPRIRIGLRSQFPTRVKAGRAAQAIRDQFNGVDGGLVASNYTLADVILRYEREEMPAQYSTRRGYMQIHRNHLMPRWAETPIAEVRPLEARAWLLSLPIASRTRGHILGQMRVLFRHAMLWGWLPAQVNPLSLFSLPGSTKRTRKPRVIAPAQFRQLLQLTQDDLERRAMLVGAYCLGIRVSELFALQWRDFDFFASKVEIRRAVVEGRVGTVKTQASEAPLPLASDVAQAFLDHYKAAPDPKRPSNWVFPSRQGAGKKPMDSRNLQTKFLTPLGKQINLDFALGWHTFRHSYKVLLERAGVDLTVQRDLMRHADTHTTSQIYGEVEFDRMRDANDRAVALAFEGKQ